MKRPPVKLLAFLFVLISLAEGCSGSRLGMAPLPNPPVLDLDELDRLATEALEDLRAEPTDAMQAAAADARRGRLRLRVFDCTTRIALGDGGIRAERWTAEAVHRDVLWAYYHVERVIVGPCAATRAQRMAAQEYNRIAEAIIDAYFKNAVVARVWRHLPDYIFAHGGHHRADWTRDGP